MGIFGNSALEQRIDRCTSDKNTSEDWAVILDVCDRVKESAEGPKECIRALKSKLASDNPRIALQAVTLLDACVNNCGNKFLLEVASREFEQELRKLITSQRTHKKVSDKLRQCLKSWAEGDFKNDRQLSLVPDLYKKLQAEGYDFSNTSDSPVKKSSAEYSTDPNVVNNKQEEDDIAQAIQLSLQTAKQPTHSSTPSSLYGDLSKDLVQNFDSALSFKDSKGASGSPEPKKARALYDFEAVEDNELTFKAGELIVVVDDTDPNWWKGTNHLGEGLFPANFVTTDIHGGDQGQEQASGSSRSEKRVSFSESVKVTELQEEEREATPKEAVTGEIDEGKIDYLLHLLHEADPTGERPDAHDLPNMEEQVSAMAPTIDAELEQVDRKHNELSKLNNDLMGALNLYHQLMREMPVSSMGYYPPTMYGGPMGPMDPSGVAPPHPQQQAQVPGYPPMYAMMGQHAPMPQHHYMPQHPMQGGMPLPADGSMGGVPPNQGPMGQPSINGVPPMHGQHMMSPPNMQPTPESLKEAQPAAAVPQGAYASYPPTEGAAPQYQHPVAPHMMYGPPQQPLL